MSEETQRYRPRRPDPSERKDQSPSTQMQTQSPQNDTKDSCESNVGKQQTNVVDEKPYAGDGEIRRRLRKVDLIVEDPRLEDTFSIPQYETDGSAGVDLRAMIDKPIDLGPGETAMVSSGIRIHIGDPNFAGFIYPRSGKGAKQGLVIGNQTGIIDSDYQGVVMICLYNRNPSTIAKMRYFDAARTSGELIAKPNRDATIRIHPGDRVAQMIFQPIERVIFSKVNAFKESSRGEGGFGHTGEK